QTRMTRPTAQVTGLEGERNCDPHMRLQLCALPTTSWRNGGDDRPILAVLGDNNLRGVGSDIFFDQHNQLVRLYVVLLFLVHCHLRSTITTEVFFRPDLSVGLHRYRNRGR